MLQVVTSMCEHNSPHMPDFSSKFIIIFKIINNYLLYLQHKVKWHKSNPTIVIRGECCTAPQGDASLLASTKLIPAKHKLSFQVQPHANTTNELCHFGGMALGSRLVAWAISTTRDMARTPHIPLQTVSLKQFS